MATATARVTVLMPPDEKAKLVHWAKQAGVSVGEFVRGLLLDRMSDEAFEAELQRHRPEIENLLDELDRRHIAAMDSVDRALAEVATLQRERQDQDRGHQAG